MEKGYKPLTPEAREAIFESVFKPQPKEARPTLPDRPTRTPAQLLEVIERKREEYTPEDMNRFRVQHANFLASYEVNEVIADYQDSLTAEYYGIGKYCGE